MRLASALLVTFTLLLGSHVARGQEKKYTIEDLQALVKSGSWDEASQHLEDVPPSKRDTRWKTVVEQTAMGQLKALDTDRSPLDALIMADAYTKRFNFLAKSRPFMQVRADLGIKGFESCFEARWSTETCSDRLLPFVEGDRGNVDLAVKAALLQVRNAYSYFAAPLYKLVAEWGKGSKKACSTDRLAESTLAAMGLPAQHKMLPAGLRVADVCFPHLKTKLQESAGESSYTKANICPLLRKKKAMGNAKCGGGS